MKSPVVIRSTEVSKAFRTNLKQRPISFLETREIAQISLNVLGTPVKKLMVNLLESSSN